MSSRKMRVRDWIVPSMLSAFVASAAAAQTAGVQDVESLKQALHEQQAQIQNLQRTLQEQEARQRELLQALQQIESNSRASTTAASNDASPAAGSDVTRGPAPVQSGFGKVTFDGLLQAWYYAGDGGFADTFRIRRTELKLAGEVSPAVKWTVMIDPAKSLSLNNTYTTVNGAPVLADTSVGQGSRILQDAFITLSHSERLNVNVGQFKIPLSLEGLQSSAELDTERALFATDRARGGSYGDIRDIGVMAFGSLSPQLSYQVGVFNGSGETQNQLDQNDRKAVAARLVYKLPFVSGLQVGASGVRGNGEHADNPRHDRLGFELLYQNGPLTLQSEYMAGRDGRIEREGYYTHVAWQLTPRWEASARYDTWDPDTALESTAASVTERDYVTGLSYLVEGHHAKLQLNYVRKTFADDLIEPFNQAVLRWQTWW